MKVAAKPIATPIFATHSESRELVEMLAATRLFAKYARSFSAASGLPLSIRPIESFQMPAHGQKMENPFCALMSKSRKGCVACLQNQSKLEQLAATRSSTLRCYANLHDTFVPLRVGEKIVAYLQTGQVSLTPLGEEDFERTHSELILKGIEVDASEAKTAYLKSKYISRDAYHGFVKMLEIFAESLGYAANTLLLKKRDRKESGIVAKAITYLKSNFANKVTLAEISKIAGSSERHFCKVFKNETGLTFVSYLTRLRVEEAKRSLRETRQQVSEIAFASGFESIPQFNRSFKQVSGDSPSRYRKVAMA